MPRLTMSPGVSYCRILNRRFYPKKGVRNPCGRLQSIYQPPTPLPPTRVKFGFIQHFYNFFSVISAPFSNSGFKNSSGSVSWSDNRFRSCECPLPRDVLKGFCGDKTVGFFWGGFINDMLQVLEPLRRY